MKLNVLAPTHTTDLRVQFSYSRWGRLFVTTTRWPCKKWPEGPCDQPSLAQTDKRVALRCICEYVSHKVFVDIWS